MITKYKEYISILQYFMEKAFEQVWKEQIFPYSVDGISPPQQELETAERNFIKLTFELIGTKIKDVLCTFFGSERNLIENLHIFFESKTDSDQIRDLISKKNSKE